MGYDVACLWSCMSAEIEKSLPEPLWQKVKLNFTKGAYDRELQQHVKTMDPEFGMKDLRFLELLRGDSTTTKSLAQKEVEAAQELEAASFKKFAACLKKEQQLWTDYLASVKTFDARAKASKLEWTREQDESFSQAGKNFMETWTPVIAADADFVVTAIQTQVGQFAVKHGLVDEQVYQVILVDFTKLGSAYSKYQTKVISQVAEMLASNPAKSMAIVLAPNTSHWGAVYSEEKISESIKSLEEDLKDWA